MTTITSLGNTDSAVRQFLSSTATYFSRPLAILRNYHLSDLQPDLLSGLTVGVVMLPQAMAYALIAELPPETGLYAAIVASIIGALWGSSSHLHTGPTNAASLLVLSTLSTVALVGSPEYLAAAGLLAVMVGIFRLVMGLARMGMLVNFVSDSVIIGFTAGAGVLIAVNQLKHLFGIPVESSPLFLQTLFDLIANLDQIHWASLAVGLLTIGVMLLIQWKTPKIPSALAGMIVASLAVFVFNLDEKGVAVLGALPRGLPPLASVPIFDWQLISQLSTGALAISLIGLVEAMSIARAIASQSGEHIDNNQEFVGQGLANIATGFFSGYTCSGSFTRSAVNFASGGRTAIAVVASGIFVLLAMFVVAPLAAYIPRAALAALLVVTAYRMVDLHEIRRIWHTTKGDSFIMAATLAATLFLPLEFAVLTGVLASFARFIAETSHPGVYSMLPDSEFAHLEHQPEKPVCPQLGVITIEGSLYFGATSHVEEEIRRTIEEHPEQRYLLLQMDKVNLIDISGLHMLETVVRLYRQQDGDIFMTGVRQSVRRKMTLSGFDEALGLDHFLAPNRAIEHIFYRILDPSICIYRCEIRAWRECQSLPKATRPAPLPEDALMPVTTPVRNLEPYDLWRKMLETSGSGPLLIDVREAVEFEEYHIAQTQLIPMPEMLANPPDLPRDREIILICRTGRRSTQVARDMQRRGYQRVENLNGGILAWMDQGLPYVHESEQGSYTMIGEA